MNPDTNNDKTVQFGCIRCKRTKRTKAMDDVAEKTMLSVIDAAYDLMVKEGQQLGYAVPPNLKQKLYKWGIKASILPEMALDESEAKTRKLANDRNKLD